MNCGKKSIKSGNVLHLSRPPVFFPRAEWAVDLNLLFVYDGRLFIDSRILRFILLDTLA
jgi:hypothetical protein